MFRLAHLSDPHMGPLPEVALSDLASKRIFGYVNWQRNRGRSYTPAVLSALVADILAQKPDHTVVTGDLVNLGLTKEFETARNWLRGFGAPSDVTVIPGNHDAYVPGALAELTRIWHPFMAGDSGSTVAFPFVRRRGRIALVGLSSAIPTAPLMATGKIGAPQAAALTSRLTTLGRAGYFRVVLIHHPPARHVGEWTRRLIDGDLFRRAIAEGGAELILHGHNHRTSVTFLDGRDGPVPLVGAAAASVSPRRGREGGSYCLFDIDDSGGGFKVTLSERGVRGGSVVETIADHALTADVASRRRRSRLGGGRPTGRSR